MEILSFRIGHPDVLRFRVCLIDGSHLLTEGFALCTSTPGCLDALDATPASTGPGGYLAHLVPGVMRAAVVAVQSF